jgi:hypothetical protein
MAAKAGRTGLQSIRRWAERAGGTLRIESDLGGGTRVIAELPMEMPGPDETLRAAPAPAPVIPGVVKG